MPQLMRPSQSITFGDLRTRVSRVSPGVWVRVAGLWGLATAVVLGGWGWLLALLGFGGLGAAGLVAAAAPASLLIGMVVWGFLGQRDRVRRLVLAWGAGMAITALATTPFVDPWWMSGALILVSILTALVLRPLVRAAHAWRVTSLGLPSEVLPLMVELPQNLPADVQAIMTKAFQDWMLLRELIRYSSQSALRQYVDFRGLETSAQRTVLYMLARAPVVSKLLQVAAEHRDEKSVAAGARATRRLESVSMVLHDAVAAVSEFAASEAREDAAELQIRTDGLKELALNLNTDVLDVAEDVRLRFEELERQPSPAASIPLTPDEHELVESESTQVNRPDA